MVRVNVLVPVREVEKSELTVAVPEKPMFTTKSSLGRTLETVKVAGVEENSGSFCWSTVIKMVGGTLAMITVWKEGSPTV